MPEGHTIHRAARDRHLAASGYDASSYEARVLGVKLGPLPRVHGTRRRHASPPTSAIATAIRPWRWFATPIDEDKDGRPRSLWVV
jgi:hypothetical protein